jgi:hypothetical protein
MSGSFEDEIREALTRKPSGTELVDITCRHRDAGLSQQAAYDVLKALVGPIEEQLGEEAYDRVLDHMDIVVGFCRPELRIWKEQLKT